MSTGFGDGRKGEEVKTTPFVWSWFRTTTPDTHGTREHICHGRGLAKDSHLLYFVVCRCSGLKEVSRGGASQNEHSS